MHLAPILAKTIASIPQVLGTHPDHITARPVQHRPEAGQSRLSAAAGFLARRNRALSLSAFLCER